MISFTHKFLKYLICLSVISLLSSCQVAANNNDLECDHNINSEDNYQTQICALAQNPKIQSSFSHIENSHERSLSELITLTQIPAPPFNEEARSKAFAKMLEETGFGTVSIDEVGNVIARRKGTSSKRTIAIGAHIDTVFPIETDVTVRKEGDTYYAPGIGDNTRGLILLLEIARAIVAENIQTEADILLTGNVGEEGLGDLRGVRHLFRQGAKKIDTFIAIDGGQTNRLIYGGVGSLRYRVTFKGPGGHSWGAFGLANPHHAIGRAIAEFVQDAPKILETGDKTTYNIGRMGGGTSINSIPFESWMEVDLRSEDPVKLAEIDAVFKAAMERALIQENEARKQGDALSIDVKPVGNRPAGKGNIQTPVVQYGAAAMKIFGLTPQFSISSTDANIPISMNIPAITIARGGISRNAHALDENWTDKDTDISTKIALLVLLSEAVISNFDLED